MHRAILGLSLLISASGCVHPIAVSKVQAPKITLASSGRSEYFPTKSDEVWIISASQADAQRDLREACGHSYVCTQTFNGTLIVIKKVRK